MAVILCRTCKGAGTVRGRRARGTCPECKGTRGRPTGPKPVKGRQGAAQGRTFTVPPR